MQGRHDSNVQYILIPNEGAYLLAYYPIKLKKAENLTFCIYITSALELTIHTTTYIIVVDIHNGFEKTTKHLLDGIIDFISLPCSCGFRSCHLLHRYLLLLSLYFPCGTHIISIFQKNKCILTNQVSRTFAIIIYI